MSTKNTLKQRFQKDMLRREDLAEYLDVSIGTISNLVRDEKVPYIKLGGATSSIRFDAIAISEWIDDMNSIGVQYG